VRAFLRQDPSAIMVGEMRDAETAAAGLPEHGQGVRTEAHAAERTTGSDEHNARLIAPTATRADLSLDPTQWHSPG